MLGIDGARLRADTLADDNDLRADPTTNPSYEPTLAYAPSSVPSESNRRAPTRMSRCPSTAVCAGYVSIEASACDSLFCAGIACAFSRMCDATCGLCYMAAEPVPAPTAAPMRASGAPSARPSPAPSAPTALPTFGRTGVVQIILAPHGRDDASVIRDLRRAERRPGPLRLDHAHAGRRRGPRPGPRGGRRRRHVVRAGGAITGGLVRRTARAGPLERDLVFDEGFDFAALDVAASI